MISGHSSHMTRTFLEQRQRVRQDQSVLIDIALVIGAQRGVAPEHADVFEWARLNGVAQIGVTLPLSPFPYMGSRICMVAPVVACGEG